MTNPADYKPQPHVIGNGVKLQSEVLKYLLDYQQADMDGIMVLVSRQAIHEVADEMKALQAENTRLTEAQKSARNDAIDECLKLCADLDEMGKASIPSDPTQAIALGGAESILEMAIKGLKKLKSAETKSEQGSE